MRMLVPFSVAVMIHWVHVLSGRFQWPEVTCQLRPKLGVGRRTEGKLGAVGGGAGGGVARAGYMVGRATAGKT